MNIHIYEKYGNFENLLKYSMKNSTIEIRWTIRFLLLVLAWAIGEKYFGLHDIYIKDYAIYSSLFAFPAILFYYLALKDKKKYFYNGEMTFSQGFVSSVILSFLIAILMPAAQFVIYKSISPDFFTTMIDYKVKNKYLSLETAKTFFNLKTYMIEGAFGALSKGIVTGTIISYFIGTKK
ncbi:DUF4199 domain-containing protein [Flavobacterium sp. j3]|uniref:DUF4199 domain-containing protein n=1 Tax=Flavobacterium aureirubrum TaxID=3133147 RepID=A0ABU9N3C9_9FLAO